VKKEAIWRRCLVKLYVSCHYPIIGLPYIYWHVCIYGMFVYIMFPPYIIYEKRRVVMIECAIKICLNKERKEKDNYYFSLDFTEFIWMKSWTMCQCHHSHISSCIHSRQGFHLGLWPFLNPLLILCYKVCVEVSLLHSLPTTICAAVGSVVCQVALLPPNNGLCYSEQCCMSGHSAPFLHW